MARVHRDQWGLWVSADGYVARPLGIETRFSKGDEVCTHHFGGSTDAGVGKDASCGRGKYLETWTTTGMSAEELRSRVSYQGRPITDDDIEADLEFYRRRPNSKLHASAVEGEP